MIDHNEQVELLKEVELLKGKTVVIVDDEDEYRNCHRKACEAVGAVVVGEYKTVLRALKGMFPKPVILKGAGKPMVQEALDNPGSFNLADIVLTDHRAEPGYGTQIIHTIGICEEASHVACVLITGDDSVGEDKVTKLANGAQCVSKLDRLRHLDENSPDIKRYTDRILAAAIKSIKITQSKDGPARSDLIHNQYSPVFGERVIC